MRNISKKQFEQYIKPLGEKAYVTAILHRNDDGSFKPVLLALNMPYYEGIEFCKAVNAKWDLHTSEPNVYYVSCGGEVVLMLSPTDAATIQNYGVHCRWVNSYNMVKNPSFPEDAYEKYAREEKEKGNDVIIAFEEWVKGY